MVRSSKRNEFKYERVSFDDDDDDEEDDEAELERILGGKPKSQRKLVKCLRGCFVVSMILVILGTITSVSLYEAGVLAAPGWFKTPLFNRSNVTSGEDGEDISLNMTTLAPSGNTSSKTSSSEDMRDGNATTPLPEVTTNKTVNENQSKNESSLDSNVTIKSTTAMTTTTSTSGPLEADLKSYFDYLRAPPVDAKVPKEEEETRSPNLPSTDYNNDVDDEDEEYDDADGDKEQKSESQIPEEEVSTTSVDPTTAKSHLNSKEDQGDMKDNVADSKGQDKPKATYMFGWTMTTMIVACISVGSTVLIVLIGLCCLCRVIRRRKQNKQQQLNKLMKELNTSDKFAIVSPSEEEDSD